MESDLLLIGEVAKRTGVSVDTVRHYERKGLLQTIGRDSSGYRRYAPEVVNRVRVIRRALEIGFSLDELARIFRQRSAGQPPCAGVYAMAKRKLEELDGRIAALQAFRAALCDTLVSWDQRLKTTDRGGFAHLLESLI